MDEPLSVASRFAMAANLVLSGALAGEWLRTW
jgi:hypothetical protein